MVEMKNLIFVLSLEENYFWNMNINLRSRNVLTPQGLKDAVIIVENGKIKEVVTDKSFCDITDHGDLVIMPALTDTHVHINEPGRTEWEGFETATKAAAAGGITMLADMPLNSSPVTTNVNALNDKIKAAGNKIYVNCGFYGGVIPGNENELKGLADAGVLGFKAFMIDSGIDEFPHVNEPDLRKALTVLNILKAASAKSYVPPLLVHAEIDCGCRLADDYTPTSFSSFCSTRPGEWECKAIELLIQLCKEFDYHIHIVHLAASEAIDMIREAKAAGIKITAETCPHYLFFSSGKVKDGDTRFKCTPPIRDDANREKLWEAVTDGTIDFIVSDHSPCEPELKLLDEGNFEKAWGGISSLQLSLSVMWTEGRKRGMSINDISRLMSVKTASFIGLAECRGKIEKGYDADLIIFDPEKKFTVDGRKLFHKHKVTPYDGEELYGSIVSTYLGGEIIFSSGNVIDDPIGKLIFNS